MQFIFDVDGTLTPSRKKIVPEFREVFDRFAQTHAVYLVTGSDHLKTREQLGPSINYVRRVYNCSGSEIWEKNTCIWAEDWTPSSELLDTLIYVMRGTKFTNLTGKHIEYRPGMINFSVVGRNAGFMHRQEYVDYDKKNQERVRIAELINDTHTDVTATVGGETGIDIFPKGKDKTQILKDFNVKDVAFFGDAIYNNGNDFTIAQAIKEGGGVVHSVKDYKDTEKLIMEYM